MLLGLLVENDSTTSHMRHLNIQTVTLSIASPNIDTFAFHYVVNCQISQQCQNAALLN